MHEQAMGQQNFLTQGKATVAAATGSSNADLPINSDIIRLNQRVHQWWASAISISAGKQPGLVTLIGFSVSVGHTSARP